MKVTRLLFICAVLFAFPKASLSQVAPVLSLDSLQGFDEYAVQQSALNEGFYGQAFTNIMNRQKRQFVIYKYGLYAHHNDPSAYVAGPVGGGKYGTGAVANAPCVNEDFESGTLAGWTASLGDILGVSTQTYPTTPTPISSGSLISVVTTTLLDPYVGVIPHSPLGGTKIVKINNDTRGAKAIKMRQTFSVTPTNYLFEFAYWAVMEDAPNHNCTQTPYMLIKLFDNNGNPQTCPVFSIVAPATGSGTNQCSGIGPLTWTFLSAGGTNVRSSVGWQKFSIDLTPHLVSAPFPYKNVTVEVIVADCNQGGHFGYAYFDSHCNTMDLTVNSVLWSMPSATVTPQVLCGGTATMTAPGGLGPYFWSGPTGTSIAQTIITSVPGNYTLNMNPAYICNTISKVVNLQFVPPTTVTASPANICTTGSNTVSVLSASGASQYTWMPGGFTTSTIAVSPTSTAVYTLTARTGTCTGTYTIQVTVNPDPVFNVVSSNSNLCPGQTATLTAIGIGGTYSYGWNPGSMTGSVVAVSQSSTTTYTTIATSTAGCTSSFTTTIGMLSAPPVSILSSPPITGPICPGSPANLIGIGAPSFTWMPDNVTGIFQTFTPTITTTYTAIGASGSCTNSAMFTVTIDPGPSMTVSANPTITCPGNTTTLSVVAPLAVGPFTWNPGATNAPSITVTSTLTGGYSVTATNSLGCRNTQTINPTLSPVPNISISPPTPTVCDGNSIALTASGALNYTFNPGGITTNPASFTPTGTSTYTVIGVNGAGCINQATVTVTVITNPTVSATINPTAICAGSCATITPNGASSYSISGGTFVVCPATNSLFVLTGTNSSGCVSAPLPISLTVNSNPIITPTANPANICSGNSSTLTATGATSYTWTDGSTTSVTALVAVSPSSTKTYTVTGINASGCTSSSFVTVNVTPTPTININPPAATVCPGGTISPVASGATNYTWNPGNLSGASPVLAPSGTTTYTIDGSTGSCTGQTLMVVTVAPSPVITATYNPGTICAGNCATLSATGSVTNYIVSGLTAPVACPVANTNYSVYGIDANGCRSNTVTGTLFVNPAPSLTASTGPATICAGSSSTLTGSGATSYTWTDGSTSSVSAIVVVSPSSTKNYTLIGMNASGCTSSTFVTVSVVSPPSITITPPAATVCPGGTISPVASGATNYTWNPGNLSGASPVLAPSGTTTYTIDGSNGTCTGQTLMVVTVAPSPVITATYNPGTICAGNCATLSATGSVTNYIVSGLTAPVACPVANTNYSVYGIDANGCRSNTVTGTLFVNPAPSLTASTGPATICAGSSSTLTGSGATSYTWTDGSTSSVSAIVVVSPSSTKNYTLIGMNASGCTSSTFVTVSVVSPPSITITPPAATVCPGGTISPVASGATNYTWNPGNLSGASPVLAPSGTTTYTIDGSNGTCTGQTLMVVTVAPSPVITATYLPGAICAGNCATLSATGSVTNYIVSGLTAPVACPASSSNYSVYGIDANGCRSNTVTGILVVNNSSPITATANSPTICAGSSSTLTATGATSYTWTDGSTTSVSALFIVSPPANKTYTVTGTNSFGCISSNTVSVAVTTVAPMSATATPTAICSGGNSSLTASGSGSGTYNWMPGSLSGQNVFVNPSVPTTYTVTGSTSGCPVSATVFVNVNTTPTLNVNTTPLAICAGSSVSFTLSGANTYSWSDGATSVTRTLSPTANTTLTILGFGSTGCVSNPVVVTVTVNSIPVITTTVVPSIGICSGANATLVAGGANTYTWMPGNLTGTSVIVNPTSSQIYTVTGTGPGNCAGSANANVNVTPALTLAANASPSTACIGDPIVLSATGASNYTWLPGGLPGSIISVTLSSSSTFTLIGNTGPCTTQTTVAVNIVSPPSLSISATATSICTGGCTTLTASGASTYSWSNSITGPTDAVCPTSGQTYTVIGSNGTCLSVATISIAVNPVPSLTITSSSNPICSGSSANLTASGASTYSWSTGALQPTINVAPATNSVYTVTGFNGSGCSSTLSFTQNVVPASNITITATSSSICAGSTVGLTANAGSPLSFTWMPGGSNLNPFVDTPASTTVYTVSALNGGCTSNATVNIQVVPLPSVTLTANPASICPGGTTTLTASGANTYTWIPSLAGGSTFTDNPGTTTAYTVVGLDITGCANYTTATVSVAPAPSILANASSASVCVGSSATLTANGANSYTWMPISQNGSLVIVNPTSATIYTVSGDNGGCASSVTVALGVYIQPTITAVASSPSICPGNTVGLTGGGGISYTWNPTGLTGANIIDTPSASTTYSVLGEDSNGCTNTGTVFVFVNPMAGVSAVASPTGVCDGGTVTLTGSGALSYTWNPGGQNLSQITETVTASTVYTLLATDASGCTGSFTVPVAVYPTPTVSASPVNLTICAGSSTTLTATGASNYTWLPSGTNGSVTVESPLAQTNYTLIGDNGGLCFGSYTFDIYVNPLPQNVGASSAGTVGCASQTVALTGTCTDTNVSFFWSGPSGYTSSVQNPIVSGIWGNFTLSVSDNVTGCIATTTVDVPTDNTIPSVTVIASGSITCANPTVTLNAYNTTTNPAYSWVGPAGFTSTLQSPAISVEGSYTITVTDLSSTCTGTAVIAVGAHTRVAITASISPATCDGNGGSNNDGTISVMNFTLTDKYDIVSGTSYTGTATYPTAASIPTNGIITNNLANPSTTVAYTLRLFDVEGCIKDTTLYLIPVDCSRNTFGIAKAVSAPVLNEDGSYNLTYTVVVKNYDLGMLKDISLTENLSNTFPAPTSFTVVNNSQDSTRISAGSGLTLNEDFDGNSQTNLLIPGSNTLAAGQADTIQFTVKVNTSLFFVGFKNSVIGSATNVNNKVILDSSNTGLNPDPDVDGNPFNNNLATVISFAPKQFFGITKIGEINKSDNESYDVTYTVTVHNLGNDTLYNVSLHDSLFGKTIKDGASYSIRSGPVTSGGGLVANTGYDGNMQSGLVDPAQSKMPPRTVSSVYFTINVITGNVTSISNSAYGSALSAISATDYVTVSDTSNAGTDPDVNNNGVWNEAVDNVPTVLLVPTTQTLFVPEGFSPDGDNVNQYFVIQGLPTDGNNSITIFNRWGNKVYYNANYDNTWDGTPNVSGTLGKDKLPPGTYYYVLEIKGSQKKSITGFVVLQY